MKYIRSQNGFAHWLLVAVLVGAIVGAGFFAYRNVTLSKLASSPSPSAASNTSPSPSTSANLKTYNYGDFTLRYPTEWATEVSDGGASGFQHIIGKPVNFWPTKDRSGEANVTVLEFSAGSDYLNEFYDAWGFSVKPSATPVKVNGADGYYVVEKNSNYTDLNYILYGSGHVVSLHFRLSEAAAGNNPTVDNSRYKDSFEAIAHSVSFQ